MASGFSSIMKLTDLNDFIAPSLECVKPVTAAPAPLVLGGQTVRGLIQLEDDFGVQGAAPAPPQKATINLSDCLACSGVLSERAVEVVVSMCPQAVLSLAHKHSLPPQECAHRLAAVETAASVPPETSDTHRHVHVESLGATEVWDTNLARSIALLEAAQEVKERLAASDPAALPVLASACPGWICYAEKTQTQKVLDHISRCRSPQQVMGALVNKVWAAKENKQLDKVYHVTLMPCYDKKLEASRLEFEDELTHNKDVDCVITAIEVEQMLQEDSTDLRCVPPSPLSLLLSTGELVSHAGSSAGGYADFVLRYVAETLYNTDIGNIQWKTLKNADLQEASLEVGGEVVFLVCRAYGFRNLQNIVQKLKRGKSQYHYVEVMACPSGCLNGGAQVRPEPGTSAKELVTVLEGLYDTLPCVDPRADTVALEVLSQLQDSQPHIARTSYKLIEKNVTSLTIKW